MIAWLLRLAQGVAGAGVLLAGWAGVSPAWIAGALAIGLIGHGAVLGLEQLMAAAVHGDDPVPRPGARARLRATLREMRAGWRVFGAVMPWRASVPPDRPVGRGRGVLMVHGYLCNRGVWHRASARWQAEGVAFEALTLEPPFAPIEAHAGAIDAALARLARATGQPPLILAHSMGGLAVRAWWASRVRAGEAPQAVTARVYRVITVGTPHRGTWLARFGRQPPAWQMRQDSAWLRDLAEVETPAWRARLTCVHSACDNVVFPPSTACLDGAQALRLDGRAHLDLLDDPGLWARVRAEREAPDPGDP